MGCDPKLGRGEFSFGSRTFWKYWSFFLPLLHSKLRIGIIYKKNWACGPCFFGSCKCGPLHCMLSGHKKGKQMEQIQPKNKTKLGPAARGSLGYSKYGPLYVKFSTNTVQFIVFLLQIYVSYSYLSVCVLQNTCVWLSLYSAYVED